MKLDALDRFAPLFPQPGRPYDAFQRRRDRKRRQKRVGSALVAIVVAAAAVGSLIHVFNASKLEPPANHTVSPADLKNLKLEWSTSSGKVAEVQPLVTRSTVVVSGDNGLTAFTKACSTPTCRPAWTYRLAFGPVTDGGVVYASSTRNYPLVALDAASGAVLWHGGPSCSAACGGDAIIGNGNVYLTLARHVSVFPTPCEVTHGVCDPVGGWYLPAKTWLSSAGDGIVVARGPNGIADWPSSCSAKNCVPLWTVDVRCCINRPIMAGDAAYTTAETSGGLVVHAYTRCPTDGTTCRPTWTAASRTILRGVMSSCCSAAATDGMVFAIGHNGKVYRFDAMCAANPSCTPPAVADIGIRDWDEVSIADGILFGRSSFQGGILVAYSAGCLEHRSDCAPLWSTRGIPGLGDGVGPPTIDGHALYVVSRAGKLFAFSSGRKG
jgi:hypothetical protein